MMFTPNEETIERFHHDGFVAGPIVLAGERLVAVGEAVDRILSGRCEQASQLAVFRRDRNAPNAQVHVVGAWRAEQVLREVAFDPAIVGLVCALIGVSSVRLFRDQLFVKAPHSETGVPWHQDYSDWTDTAPPRHVTCWVALDDASEANGCLRYVPGSHRGPLLPKISIRDDMDSALARLPIEMRTALVPRPVPVPAGGCVLHHCMTVHASFGNHTATTRRAIAISYAHPDTRFTAEDRRPGSLGPPRSAGTRLDQESFPELRAT